MFPLGKKKELKKGEAIGKGRKGVEKRRKIIAKMSHGHMLIGYPPPTFDSWIYYKPLPPSYFPIKERIIKARCVHRWHPCKNPCTHGCRFYGQAGKGRANGVKAEVGDRDAFRIKYTAMLILKRRLKFFFLCAYLNFNRC